MRVLLNFIINIEFYLNSKIIILNFFWIIDSTSEKNYSL